MSEPSNSLEDIVVNATPARRKRKFPIRSFGYFLCGLIAVAAVILWQWSDRAENEPAVASQRATNFDKETNTPVSDSPELSETANSQITGSVGLIETAEQASAWIHVDETTVAEHLLPKYPTVVENRVLVQFDKSLKLHDVDDVIEIHIPQLDTVFKGEIVGVDKTHSYTRTYEGVIRHDGVTLPFVITAGEISTFAHLPTFRGSYELVGNTEYGWLMPTANMSEHVDYSVPDYFIKNPDPRAWIKDDLRDRLERLQR